MRSIWQGAISFGLINIPVKLYSATSARRLDFDMLHKKDLSRVGYLRVCKANGEEVPMTEIVKGYEYQKGDYVVLSDEDFRKADVKKTNTIEIVDFTKEEEVNTDLYEKPYYLEPAKGAAKVYALLVEALKQSKKVGVARFVLRTQEHLGVLKPEDNMLILNEIRFAEELKKPNELEVPKEKNIPKRELDMALQLIDHLTVPFQAEKYKDTYTEELKEIIEKKAKGQKITVANNQEPKPTQVTDLMATLRKSLEQAKKSGGEHAYATH